MKRRNGTADPPQSDDEGQRLARQGGRLQSANLVRSADLFWGGRRGGQRHPSPAANVEHRVGWLTDQKAVSQPLGGAAKRASPGIVRNSLDQAVACKLLGLLVVSLKDGKGDRPGS